MAMNLFVQMTAGWMLETGIEIVGVEERLNTLQPWGWGRMALVYVLSGRKLGLGLGNLGLFTYSQVPWHHY